LEELKVEPADEKLRRYKYNWLRHVTGMNSSKMANIVLNCRPNERRRLGRALERLLDEAETGLSRPNWWRVVVVMMMMMMMIMMIMFGRDGFVIWCPETLYGCWNSENKICVWTGGVPQGGHRPLDVTERLWRRGRLSAVSFHEASLNTTAECFISFTSELHAVRAPKCYFDLELFQSALGRKRSWLDMRRNVGIG